MEFEKNYSQKKVSKEGDRKRKSMADGEPKAKRAPGERQRGFDRGLDPERIIGATDSSEVKEIYILKVTCYASESSQK